MSVSVSNVSTTEYASSKLKVQNTEQTPINSIVAEAQAAESAPQLEETKQPQTNLDKAIDKLCVELKKYNITADDVKNLLCKATGLDTNKLAEDINKKTEQQINKLIECVKQGILDSIENGKINFEQAAKGTNNYIIAISTGWSSAAKFKEWNESHADTKVSLFKRLTQAGYLPKSATKENTSAEDLKNAIHRFFSEMVGKLGNKPTASEIKGQLQTFGRLLINSPDDEKATFFEVAKDLYKDNKLPGIKAIFNNAMTKEKKNELAKIAYDPQYLEEITCEGSAMSEEDSQSLTKVIVENSNEKDIPEAHNKLNEVRQVWMKQNKEALDIIKNKLAEAEKNNTKANLTEAEQKLLLEYNNFIKAVSSGEFIGVADGNFSDEFKRTQMQTLNTDAYNLSEETYKEILESTNGYIEEHNTELNNDIEKIKQLLDNSTDGNYSRVADGSSEDIIAPEAKTSATPSNNNDYVEDDTVCSSPETGLGFSQTKQNQETIQNYKKHKEAVYNNNESDSNETSIIKLNNQNSTDPITTQNIIEKINKAKSKTEKLDIVANSFRNIATFRKDLTEYVVKLSKKAAIIIINKLPCNTRPHLTKALLNNFKIDINDINQINMGISDKLIIKKQFANFQK